MLSAARSESDTKRTDRHCYVLRLATFHEDAHDEPVGGGMVMEAGFVRLLTPRPSAVAGKTVFTYSGENAKIPGVYSI